MIEYAKCFPILVFIVIFAVLIPIIVFPKLPLILIRKLTINTKYNFFSTLYGCVCEKFLVRKSLSEKKFIYTWNALVVAAATAPPASNALKVFIGNFCAGVEEKFSFKGWRRQ